jgi:hypothetical protein
MYYMHDIDVVTDTLLEHITPLITTDYRFNHIYFLQYGLHLSFHVTQHRRRPIPHVQTTSPYAFQSNATR